MQGERERRALERELAKVAPVIPPSPTGVPRTVKVPPAAAAVPAPAPGLGAVAKEECAEAGASTSAYPCEFITDAGPPPSYSSAQSPATHSSQWDTLSPTSTDAINSAVPGIVEAPTPVPAPAPANTEESGLDPMAALKARMAALRR